ncbi:hypothetical protein [Sharpea azabuensis]|uniref:hypothetical protein n=1 Tax=Sharpea azabuensis TaxID=322505 RepID=UPI00051C45E1|nr:hypothetical protein [Sharpea azabuensis]
MIKLLLSITLLFSLISSIPNKAYIFATHFLQADNESRFIINNNKICENENDIFSKIKSIKSLDDKLSYLDTLKKQGYVLVTSVPKRVIAEQASKTFEYQGVDLTSQSGYSNVSCAWYVSLYCIFSYNPNTGKITNTPAPRLKLEGGELANCTGTVRLGTQIARVEKVNASSVDYYAKFQIVGLINRGSYTAKVNFQTHERRPTLRESR